MTGREAKLLLAGVLGLSVALACGPATAALVVGEPIPSLVGQHDLVESLATEILASAKMAGPSSLAGPAPSEDDQNNLPRLQFPDGLLPGPAAGCSSNSLPPSTGSGSTTAALANTMWHAPPPTPEASLPSEAKTILPTGPPFELLRPPQSLSS